MIHCFYHSADLDGHCSGAIVKYRFPDAEMHTINYGDAFPWDEIKEEDEVYMVDFALQPWTDMERLMQICHLTWIDHHSSAIQSYVTRKPIHKSNCCARYDVTKAACELTWEYLFPDKPVPLAVKLLSLYDSWTYQGHELEDMVLPFQMRMRMEDLDPKNELAMDLMWTQMFHNRSQHERWVKDLSNEGRLLLRYDEAQKAKYARTYSFETELILDPHMDAPNSCRRLQAIAVNLGHTNSKVFDTVWRKECPECNGVKIVWIPETNDPTTRQTCSMCNGTGYIEPYDLMIAFVRRPDKLWNISLYSTKGDVDCGAIAKSFGGGGHRGAGGFQCKELPFEY